MTNQQHQYRGQYLYREAAKNIEKSAGYGHACGPRLCSFCGAEIESDDNFCPECGNPAGGIRCPKCGTMSNRSFCSHCNTPLNEMAHEALRLAKADPLFQKAERLAADLAELEKQIRNLTEPQTQPPRSLDTSVSQEARKAASAYASLFGDVSALKVPDEPKVVAKPKDSPVLTGDLLAKARAAYLQKAQELQQTLDSMTPPASATPEEQRNFFCARKIMTYELESVLQEWVCNYCGCHHNQPSECAEPQLGGKWILTKNFSSKVATIYG